MQTLNSNDLTVRTPNLGELVADGFIHVIGVSAGVVAVVTMLWTALPYQALGAKGALAVYGGSMVAMLSISAGYNLIHVAGWRETLRRFDQAAIFVKIAGTYTPFAMIKLGGGWGYTLLVTVWAIAAFGVATRFSGWTSERATLALYLGLGWLGLLFIYPLYSALSTPTLILLGSGGLAYTFGVVFHLWENLPYQNAIWHLFVLAGTSLHFAAVIAAIHS